MARPKKSEKTALEQITDTCASCRYFLLDDQKDEAGFCRRFPPVYVGDDDSGGWTHAVTWFSGWCGEHKDVEQ